jgi:diguanylate cyclase (GGDEF)-like protein/PAS domain S-box-containing protein
MSIKKNIFKNIIFINSFIFIGLFCVIYYLLYLNANLQLEQKLLTQETFDSRYQFQTFILLFLILTVLFSSQYFHSKFLKAKNLRIQSRSELETINQFFNKLQIFHNVRDISNQSLASLGKELGAQMGKLYIVDYLNEQLYLSATLNMEAQDNEKTLEIYRGTMGEVVAFQKIKSIKTKESLQLFIPLVIDKKTIASIVFYFDEDEETYQVTKFHQTLIQIITDFLHKEVKNEENKRYFNLIDNYVLMSSTNKEGIITHASNAFTKILGYREEELLGKSHKMIRSSNVKNDVFKNMWETIEQGEIWQEEIENIKKDNSSCWLDTTIQPDFDYHNNIIGYTSIRVDITDKKIVEKLSITDAMTNLFNRRYFDSIFPKKLSLAKRLKKNIAFCMIDIDHFKQYNDTYGHQEGDNALIKVAAILQKSLRREGDFIFRLGGEEFGMLFFTKDRDDALIIANNTRKNIESIQIEHIHNSASNYVTVSMGLYIYSFDSEQISPEDIYLQTDKLLYKSKQNGRNQVTL